MRHVYLNHYHPHDQCGECYSKFGVSWYKHAQTNWRKYKGFTVNITFLEHYFSFNIIDNSKEYEKEFPEDSGIKLL